MTATADTPDVDDVPLDVLAWQDAALRAISEQIVTVQKARNDELRRRLLARYKDDGTKVTVVHAPGTKVEIGRATVTEPTDKAIVTDRDAFADWVEQDAPTEVHYEIQAPPEFIAQVRDLLEWWDGDKNAVTIGRVVRPTYEKALLDSGVTFVPADPEDPDAGTVAVRADGEVVPGVGVQPAGEPSSHSFRFATKARTGAKTADNQLNGRQRAIKALLASGFDGLTFQDVLAEARQIEG